MTDDVLLPQSPGITVRVCIPFCPDTVRPRGDDTVDNTFLPAQRDEDDHIPTPQIFNTAGRELNPVARSKQRAHALTTTEDAHHRLQFLTSQFLITA